VYYITSIRDLMLESMLVTHANPSQDGIDFQLHLTTLTKQNTFHKHLKPHPYFHIMDGVYPMVHSLPHPFVGEVDGAAPSTCWGSGWSTLELPLKSAAGPAAAKPGCLGELKKNAALLGSVRGVLYKNRYIADLL
jgi:hypothetical protein